LLSNRHHNSHRSLTYYASTMKQSDSEIIISAFSPLSDCLPIPLMRNYFGLPSSCNLFSISYYGLRLRESNLRLAFFFAISYFVFQHMNTVNPSYVGCFEAQYLHLRYSLISPFCQLYLVRYLTKYDSP